MCKDEEAVVPDFKETKPASKQFSKQWNKHCNAGTDNVPLSIQKNEGMFHPGVVLVEL